MKFRSARKKHILAYLYILLVITLIGILLAYQAFISSVNEDKNPMTFTESLKWQLEWWYLWLVLAPFILKFARRFPVERQKPAGNLMIHLPGAFLFAALQTALHTTLNWCTSWIFSEPYPFFQAILRNGLAEGHFQLGVIFYAMLVSIASAINNYRIYQEEELKASQLEAKLAQTRFQAAKMQVYPHFLFDTLRYISDLMKVNPEAADRVIARLGDFLRLSMENIGIQEVTLQREMNFLRSYLEIEKIRFNGNLDFSVDLQAQAADAQVPNLMLQPMVETMLQRFGKTGVQGQLAIQAKRDNGYLQVQIEQQGETQSGIPLDLRAMRNRLEELYGNSFFLEHSSLPGGHSVLTLEIPFVG